MTLNHINLGVSDVSGTVSMFETYFGLHRAEGMPFSQKMAFLKDDQGALIALFKTEDVTYPQIFHIGFVQQTAKEVLIIREKLIAGGFEPEEARQEHGRLTFYFKAPGGFTVEVDAFL